MGETNIPNKDEIMEKLDDHSNSIESQEKEITHLKKLITKIVDECGEKCKFINDIIDKFNSLEKQLKEEIKLFFKDEKSKSELFFTEKKKEFEEFVKGQKKEIQSLFRGFYRNVFFMMFLGVAGVVVPSSWVMWGVYERDCENKEKLLTIKHQNDSLQISNGFKDINKTMDSTFNEIQKILDKY